jgi:hypothetical protein
VRRLPSLTVALWWLSFCDPAKPPGEQFLGVCLVEADNYPSAIRRAWREGCNPGGEINGFDLPLDKLTNAKRVILAKAPHHTLLTKAQLEEYELV